MKPRNPRNDADAIVDVVDVLLRDGAILRADVIVSVAEVPLVGIKLTAAVAGMETMTEYGLFEAWDARQRKAPVSRRQYDVASDGGERPFESGFDGPVPDRSATDDSTSDEASPPNESS